MSVSTRNRERQKRSIAVRPQPVSKLHRMARSRSERNLDEPGANHWLCVTTDCVIRPCILTGQARDRPQESCRKQQETRRLKWYRWDKPFKIWEVWEL